MTLYVEQDILCACGEEFEAALARSLNPQEDPGIREAVTGGEINVVRCPKCDSFFYVECFVLYHDPGRELIAFVHPADMRPQAGELRAQMMEQVARSRGLPGGQETIEYPPLLLFGMEELAQVLRADEDAADEAAVLEALAPGLGLDIVRLSQGTARLRGLVATLPAVPAPGRTDLAAIREGLRVLTDYNPALTRYVSLRALMEDDRRCLEGISMRPGPRARSRHASVGRFDKSAGKK